MNGKFAKNRQRLIAVALAAWTIGPRISPAADRYWDLNGTTAGTGSSFPGGTWNLTNTFWNTVANGTGSTIAWVNGNTAVFAAGSDATSFYTVTVAAAITAAGLSFEE